MLCLTIDVRVYLDYTDRKGCDWAPVGRVVRHGSDVEWRKEDKNAAEQQSLID